MFSCSNGRRCALMEWVLDGKDDCLDASDEGMSCSAYTPCQTQMEREGQLSQTGRAMLHVIEYFAKSLKVIQRHWK